MEHTQPSNSHLTYECSRLAVPLFRFFGYAYGRDLLISPIFPRKNTVVGDHCEMSGTRIAIIISYYDDATSIYCAAHKTISPTPYHFP